MEKNEKMRLGCKSKQMLRSYLAGASSQNTRTIYLYHSIHHQMLSSQYYPYNHAQFLNLSRLPITAFETSDAIRLANRLDDVAPI